MCYDVSFLTKKQADYEKRYGELADVSAIELRYSGSTNRQFYHVNAFAHESLPVIRRMYGEVEFFDWGLIPNWSGSREEAMTLSKRTVNARGEELFNKASFKLPAQERRCLILLDGFFEHQHIGKDVIPYFIQFRDRTPMSVAGLWDEWIDLQDGTRHLTVSIVTTAGNKLMAQIHNHPGLAGPRMPLILNNTNEQLWIRNQVFTSTDVETFLLPISDELLSAHPVRPIRGKHGVGNCKEAIEPFDYPRLQPGLFDM